MRAWMTSIRMVAAVVLILTVPNLASGEDGARDRYRAGAEALSSDDPYRAVDEFRTALRLNPAYVDARLGMAEALFLLGEYTEAAREIESARPYAGGDRRMMLLEARIRTALREYDEATALYRSVLQDRPNDGDANRGLAEIYAILGQREQADEAFTRSLESSPGDRRVLLQLVLVHDQALERQPAEAALNEALRVFPDDFTVRIHAAEHFALYQDWTQASYHLDRAKSMLSGPEDRRYRQVGLLDASISLRMDRPEAAWEALEGIEGRDEPKTMYMMARIRRRLGDEDGAQTLLRLLLNRFPEDEIARMLREDPLVRTLGGLDEHRQETATWHVATGRRLEPEFYYDQALSAYRRAGLIDGTDPSTWIAYAELIRKKGFPGKYRDEIAAALGEFPEGSPEAVQLRRRLDLYEHSESRGLADRWGIGDPWMSVPSRASWDAAIFVNPSAQALPQHDGAESTLARYFAYELDVSDRLHVVDASAGIRTASNRPDIGVVDDFAEAFRRARGEVDYYVMLEFSETTRSFGVTGLLYLARTGELVGRFDELRTGQGKVVDALRLLAGSIGRAVPNKMDIVAVDGDRILLDKGRWHGLEPDRELLVLRRDAGRPAIGESGLLYQDSDILGSIIVETVSESLSEGKFQRSGDFDFVSPGDQVFWVPVPENDANQGVPDPAFRSRLLSVP